MKKKRNPLSRIKIVFRPSSPVVKIVLLAVVLMSIGALILLNSAIKKQEAEQARLRQQIAQAQKDHDKYQDGIDKAGTQEGLKDYAENELGLAPGDSQIIVGQSASPILTSPGNIVLPIILLTVAILTAGFLVLILIAGRKQKAKQPSDL